MEDYTSPYRRSYDTTVLELYGGETEVDLVVWLCNRNFTTVWQLRSKGAIGGNVRRVTTGTAASHSSFMCVE